MKHFNVFSTCSINCKRYIFKLSISMMAKTHYLLIFLNLDKADFWVLAAVIVTFLSSVVVPFAIRSSCSFALFCLMASSSDSRFATSLALAFASASDLALASTSALAFASPSALALTSTSAFAFASASAFALASASALAFASSSAFSATASFAGSAGAASFAGSAGFAGLLQVQPF